jgi:pyrimidine oxygenase
MTKIGVFLPNGKNGSLISTTSPQFSPTYALNREVALMAEAGGIESVLSMVKFRGFGGKSGYWDEALESFTLMAALAEATTKVELVASVGVLALNPAVTARMAATIEAVAPGRFGINVVSGWQMAEYDQMGVWPGQSHFQRRYEYCADYVKIMRELWETGACTYKSDFFDMKDCRLGPQPSARIPIICAGQSAEGVKFAAAYGDYNFCSGNEINGIASILPAVEDLREQSQRTGRDVASAVLVLIVAAETDAEANARWDYYVQGTDVEALHWLRTQGAKDTRKQADARSSANKGTADIPNRMSRIIGSYETVAREMDRIADIPGVGGIMLSFDDYLAGMRDFVERIQPLMASRASRRN